MSAEEVRLDCGDCPFRDGDECICAGVPAEVREAALAEEALMFTHGPFAREVPE